MGPQFNPCGRTASVPAVPAVRVLQWGRSLIPAEGDDHGRYLPNIWELQWGRSLIPAEGGMKKAYSFRFASFNGAAV